jgi:glyoxylase-like metal-dependent hydrolase (beta-lactamase superfamily II)
MPALASGVFFFDLMHTGRAGFIATGVLAGADGIALVDPGPSSCLDTLRAALAERGYTTADIRWILLTHIHLDHAGATGTLLREAPHARVLVHERGVKHMVDPGKLIESATRLYGDQMAPLWGEIAPVPAGRIDAIGDRASGTIAGHDVEIAYTPGHAWHHVSYWVPSSRIAFVGDTAGMCRPGGSAVLPLTAPPDTDLDAWRDSTQRILAWDPDVLFLTHFGPHRSPRVHYQALWRQMALWRDRVAATLRPDADPTGDPARIARFSADIIEELTRTVPKTEADAYALAGRFDLSWMGLARYLRKKSA